MERWLTLKQAAQLLKLTTEGVKKQAQAGKYQWRQDERARWYILWSDQLPQPSLPTEPNPTPTVDQPSLTDELRDHLASLKLENQRLRESNKQLQDELIILAQQVAEDSRNKTVLLGMGQVLQQKDQLANQPAPTVDQPVKPPWWRRLRGR